MKIFFILWLCWQLRVLEQWSPTLGLQMFLDFNSQKSWPAEAVVKVSGSCSPRTSGDPRLGTTALKHVVASTVRVWKISSFFKYIHHQVMVNLCVHSCILQLWWVFKTSHIKIMNNHEDSYLIYGVQRCHFKLMAYSPLTWMSWVWPKVKHFQLHLQKGF